MTSNTHWTARRKLEIVRKVIAGALTLADIHREYGISAEEYSQWSEAVMSGNKHRLKATRLRS